MLGTAESSLVFSVFIIFMYLLVFGLIKRESNQDYKLN